MATNGYILGIVRRLPARPTAWTGTPRTDGRRSKQIRVHHLASRVGLPRETGFSSGLDSGDGHGLPCSGPLSLSARTFGTVPPHPCLPSSRFDAAAESLQYFSPLLISRSVLRGPRRGILGPRSTTTRPITLAPHRGNPGACRGCSIWERVFPLRQAVSLRHC